HSLTGIEYPLDPVIRRVNGWIEGPVIKHCIQAVFTAPGTLRMYSDRYSEIPQSRWAIIANGYDEDNFVAVERAAVDHVSRNNRQEQIVLVHSGVLYPSARDPHAFFAAVAELRRLGKVSPSTLKIVLRASGHEDYYQPCLQENNIEDIVFLEPPVPYHQALAEMLNVDGLLVFQASNCNWQIPAKLYEYLRARRPILALTDPGGDTAGVLKAADIDTITPLDSKEQIAQGLLNFLSKVRSGCAPIVRDKEIEHHSRKYRTYELAKLLDSVV